LLLHGTLVEGGFSGDERDYCPFNEADVRGAGFTAALLGHIHRARVHNGASRCFYPGSTQALTFNETGEHWALLFEVDPGRLTCEKIVVSDLPLAVLDVTVDEVLGEHELLERARAALAEREVSRGMAKLRLVGTRRLDAAFSAEDLAADLSDGDLLVAVADESLPGYDFEALAHGPTTRACFVRRLLAERDRAPQEEKALYQDALVLGLRAFEGAKLQPLWEPPLEEEDKER
jgi:DNA repair exonuclease SbcCD nuclease subunit